MTGSEKGALRARTALRLMGWELRGSLKRVLFWMLCLTVGVGAVVGVAGLGASLDEALRREARSLLAADLALRSGQDLPNELLEIIESEPGASIARVRETLGVARRVVARNIGASSQLVAIKAVSGGYPFYGDLDIEPPLPDGTALADLLLDEKAVVAPELLRSLGLAVGDRLMVGQVELEIAAVVHSEPDRLPGTVSIGPRVFVSEASLARSLFLGFSGFTRRKTLVGLPEGATAADAEALAERLRASIGEDPFTRVETYADAQPSLRRDLERLENFLGLAALLSLLIGGVGIAQGVSSWINSRLDSLAILKCLGLRPREVFGLYLCQAILLGLAGSLSGGIAGLGILWLVPRLLGDFIPADAIHVWQPGALVRGLALGVGVATAFSLPPLLNVLRVSPSRVFRRSAEPLPGSRSLPAAVFVLAIVSVGAVAWFQSGSFELAGLFVVGVLATVIGLAVGAFGLGRLTRFASHDEAGSRRWQRYWMRHGLAAISRPGAGTLGAIVALGLGLFVIASMSLVQVHLRDQLQGELPQNAPSAFMIDVKPDQWPGLEQLLLDDGAEHLQAVPVIRARIGSIDGRDVEEIAQERDRGDRWALTREQRLTYLEALPDDNQLLEGELWADPEQDEVSIEEEFARELGVGLGSKIVLDIDDQAIELLVTSLRRVEWEGFGINFFLVVEPGVLDEVSQIVLAAAQLPVTREQAIQDAVASAYPNVLFVRIREILDKVLILLGRLLAGIRVLGGFTVLSGLAILFGAVAASHAERGRDVALMKTLGMTRFDVLRTFAVEYALIGLAASSIALLGAIAVCFYLITREMEIEWVWRPQILFLVLFGGTLLSVIAGLLASLGALRKPPIEALRDC